MLNAVLYPKPTDSYSSVLEGDSRSIFFVFLYFKTLFVGLSSA